MNAPGLLLVGIAIIVILALAKVPLWISMICGSLFITYFVNGMPVSGFMSNMAESLNKTSLMCIPFFIISGALMQETSMARRLINFCIVLLKRVSGGLAFAAVVANGLFGAVSGSSAAAVALFSNILYKPLKDSYDEDLSLGIITSSAILSNIIPPSITFIIYGTAASTSIVKLFAAGALPGIIILLTLCVYIKIRLVGMQRKGLYTPSKVTLIGDVAELSLGKAFVEAIPIFLLLLGIFGGIYSGLCTPTEAAALSVVFCLVCSAVFRDLSLKGVLSVLKQSFKTVAAIFTLVAAAHIFAQAITLAQVPQLVSNLVGDLSKFQFLLLLTVILLIVGCLLDIAPAVLVFTPIFLPSAVALGIDPVHLGVIFVVNLSIGFITPPFGFNLFVFSSVTKAPIGRIIHAVLPYIAILIVLCLLFTYIPSISMFLPGLMK